VGWRLGLGLLAGLLRLRLLRLLLGLLVWRRRAGGAQLGAADAGGMRGSRCANAL
jgi:hypothetical protein